MITPSLHDLRVHIAQIFHDLHKGLFGKDKIDRQTTIIFINELITCTQKLGELFFICTI